MRGNPRAFFVLHSDVCCDFPVVEMNAFQMKSTDEMGFIILGAEVCVCVCVYVLFNYVQ